MVEEYAVLPITTSPTRRTCTSKNSRSGQRKVCTGCCYGLFCACSDCSAGAAVSLCAPELATMLGCWAAKNDMAMTGACAESAKALYDCMRTTVRAVHRVRFRL